MATPCILAETIRVSVPDALWDAELELPEEVLEELETLVDEDELEMSVEHRQLVHWASCVWPFSVHVPVYSGAPMFVWHVPANSWHPRLFLSMNFPLVAPASVPTPTHVFPPLLPHTREHEVLVPA